MPLEEEGGVVRSKVPVLLIQLAREEGKRSREEKVGDCLPDGLCWRIQDSFSTA